MASLRFQTNMEITPLDPTGIGANRRPSILVVDDEAAIRELLSEVLAEHGFHVMEASDGRAAVQYIGRNPVDLVIMDLVMPGQEGLESIRELQREAPQVKVIAISGYQRGAYLYHAERFGACATIKKPFSIDVVLQTVANVLRTGATDGEPRPSDC